MANKKTARRALFSSVISLMLCCCMLVGTTFAWFTDSVTSANNIIKSGTLDVTMEWTDGKEDPTAANWKDASEGAIFNYDLWEPGYTEVRHIKIANVGNLALKYQIKIVANGEVSELADVIDVYYTDPADQVANRADLTDANKIGTLTEVLAGMATTANGNLLPKDDPNNADEVTLTIALKMQETAGNEYQNKSIGSDFSIVLLATQYTYEEDSFGIDYDENATIVSNAQELADAIANGDTVTLATDIDLGNTTIVVPADKATTLNLNGNNITKVSDNADKNNDGAFSSADNTAAFTVKGDLVVMGEGEISVKHNGDNMGWNALFAGFSVEGGTLTLNEGVVVANLGGTDMSYAVDVNTTGGESVLNVNGATLYSPYVGVRIFNNNNTEKGIVNYNSGIISGGSRDIWTQIMSAPAANAVVNIAGDISYTTNTDGDRYYFDNDITYANTSDEAKDALSNASAGDTVYASGVTIEGTTGLNHPGVTLVGATFKNEGGQAVSGTIAGTYKDCTFEGAETLRWCYTNEGETLVFENCVINTTLRGVHFDVMNGDVIFRNCEINGFNAYSGNGTMTFENCTFGYDQSNYNGLNIYSNTVLKDCTFNYISGKTNFIDMEGTGKTLTIINCTATLDGAAANVSNFVGGSKLAYNTVIYE